MAERKAGGKKKEKKLCQKKEKQEKCCDKPNFHIYMGYYMHWAFNSVALFNLSTPVTILHFLNYQNFIRLDIL